MREVSYKAFPNCPFPCEAFRNANEMKNAIVNVRDYVNYKIMCTLGSESDIIRRLGIYSRISPVLKTAGRELLKEAS